MFTAFTAIFPKYSPPSTIGHEIFENKDGKVQKQHAETVYYKYYDAFCPSKTKCAQYSSKEYYGPKSKHKK